MSPQIAKAFLESLPGMRALRDRRATLGPVVYAQHMHELDMDERDAKAILKRAQLRVVAGTPIGE